MNKNDFLDAVASVDGDILDNVLRERAKLAHAPKRKSAILMRVMPIAAAVVILAAGVITAFTMANRNKPEVPGADDPAVVPPVVDTEPERTNTIVEGAFELVPPYGTGSGLLPWEGSVSIDAYSYYLKNEKIYIKVNYGFIDNDFAKKLEAGETGYPDWHPEYNLVGAVPTLQCYTSLRTFSDVYDKLLINGSNIYFHTFEEEIPYFGCDFEIYQTYDPELDRMTPHCKPNFVYSEIIELDFSNVPVGQTGHIHFQFGWSEPDNEYSFKGMGAGLMFYVGENGIGFSCKPTSDGIEHAKENVERIENAKSSVTQPEEIDFWKEQFGMPSNDTNNEE